MFWRIVQIRSDLRFSLQGLAEIYKMMAQSQNHMPFGFALLDSREALPLLPTYLRIDPANM
jgi:hypothetical protein